MRHSQDGGHLYSPELLAHREKKRLVGPATGVGARVKYECRRESNINMSASQILVWPSQMPSQIVVCARVKY